MRRARYLYIKMTAENVWGARYTLGARYLSKNTVYFWRELSSKMRKEEINKPQIKVPFQESIVRITENYEKPQ
jgi:hypothetical protein